MLKNKIHYLESKAESKKKANVIDDSDEDEDIAIMNFKKSGFRREGPQFKPKPKDSQREFKCDKCDFVLESQGLLEAFFLVISLEKRLVINRT